MITIKNYINGTYGEPSNNKWLDVIDQRTGKEYAKISNTTTTDVEGEYKAAEKA